MKRSRYFLFFAIFSIASSYTLAQSTVVVHDPTKESNSRKPTAAETAIFETSVIPKVSKVIASDVCEASPDIAGVADGSFSRPGSVQTLIFYQYCQTGNGFGWAGIALIENDKLVGSFITESGWTIDIGTVADLKKNGFDQFTLQWSGGLHQGRGGVGVDLVEFSKGVPKAIGWYQAEEIMYEETTKAWKLTAKRGSRPGFYRQRFSSSDNNKWRAVGAARPYTLVKKTITFEAVK
jgi:hypothetical protein